LKLLEQNVQIVYRLISRHVIQDPWSVSQY